MRYIIESEHTQGENWHYVCDTVTGGIVDLFPNEDKAREKCEALNDGRILPVGEYRSNISTIVAREIGGAL